MTGYKQMFLNEIIEQIGEDGIKSTLSSFECPHNKDVEYFLRHKAIEFGKQGVSQTTLVFGSHKKQMVLLGYYTLAHKLIVVPAKELSSKTRSRINRFAKYDDYYNGYPISAPLIAQLGKNYFDGYNKLMRGEELLKMACDRVADAQKAIGGRFTYLECEESPRLLEFYAQNGFVNFGKRTLDGDEKDSMSGNYLIQMMKYLH